MRALADTLRMEALRLSSPHTTYTIHIAFPSSILTPAFLAEQAIKPALTKKIESSTGPVEDLHKKVISAEKAVGQIIRAVERGEFAIAEDCLDSSLCYANAVGTSPKRGWGVFDTVVGVLATAVVWPVYRWYFDGLAKKDNIWREGRK
jgi:3-dehydrosphinganine reductase